MHFLNLKFIHGLVLEIVVCKLNNYKGICIINIMTEV